MSRPLLLRRLRSGLPLLVAVLTACGDDAPMVAAPRIVASVSVTPATVTLAEGASRMLTAEVRDQDGSLYLGSPVAWTSSDTLVAQVVPGGLVTARRPGVAIVRVSSGGKTGQVVVTVSAPPVVQPPAAPVASVTTDAAEVALGVGDARVLVARALDARGGTLLRPIFWRTSNAAVATVDSAGRVTATGAGSATITATSEGREAGVRVTVTGQLLRLTRAGSAPLPAPLTTTTLVVNGTAREATVQVTGGTVRLRNDRYELRLQGTATAAGAAPVAVSFTSDGVIAYDLIAGNGAPLFFEGDTFMDRQPRFRGRLLADGRLEIDWSIAPGATVVPLVFVP